MPFLFSYGSLQRERVQLDTFGRRLVGVEDRLPGYALSQVPITDPKRAAIHAATHYANVIATDNAQGNIPGTVLEITDAELLKADEYEDADGYARIQLEMASGRLAWVYVFNASHLARGPT